MSTFQKKRVSVSAKRLDKLAAQLADHTGRLQEASEKAEIARLEAEAAADAYQKARVRRAMEEATEAELTRAKKASEKAAKAKEAAEEDLRTATEVVELLRASYAAEEEDVQARRRDAVYKRLCELAERASREYAEGLDAMRELYEFEVVHRHYGDLNPHVPTVAFVDALPAGDYEEAPDKYRPLTTPAARYLADVEHLLSIQKPKNQ